jgi:hypothetical protein
MTGQRRILAIAEQDARLTTTYDCEILIRGNGDDQSLTGIESWAGIGRHGRKTYIAKIERHDPDSRSGKRNDQKRLLRLEVNETPSTQKSHFNIAKHESLYKDERRLRTTYSRL